jgi:hypothetical protein
MPCNSHFHRLQADAELKSAHAAIATLTAERDTRTKELENAQLTLTHTKAQLEREFAKTDGVADNAKTVEQLYKTRQEQDVAMNKYVRRHSSHTRATHSQN